MIYLVYKLKGDYVMNGIDILNNVKKLTIEQQKLVLSIMKDIDRAIKNKQQT